MRFCRSSVCSKKYLELVKKRIFTPQEFIPDAKSYKFINRTAISFCFFGLLNILLMIAFPVSAPIAGEQYLQVFSMLPGAGNIMQSFGNILDFVNLMSLIDKIFAAIVFIAALLLFSKKKYAWFLFLGSLYFGLYYVLVFYLVAALYGGQVLTFLGKDFISPQMLQIINTGFIVFSVFLTIPVFSFIWLIIRFSVGKVKEQFR